MARHSLPEDREKATALETTHFANAKTILIVDDESQVVSLVSEVFAGRGFDIITAVSGADALKQARGFDGEITMLLTDFEMPGMSGIELATRLSEVRPKIKVLMMSGFDGGMLILNEGWHFLAKPFIAPQLRALVAGLIYPDKDSRFLESPAPLPSAAHFGRSPRRR